MNTICKKKISSVRIGLSAAFIAVFSVIFSATSTSAATFVVDTNEDIGNPSASSSYTYCTDGNQETACSLRIAISAAKYNAMENNSIMINAAYENATFLLNHGQLEIMDMPSELTIDGKGATIDAQQKSGAFSMSHSTVTLQNMTITHGLTTHGGGMYVFADNNLPTVITLEKINVTANQSQVNGGGIYVLADISAPITMHIHNSTISNNNAPSDGGGIYALALADSSIALNVENTVISNNMAMYDGGGMYSHTETNAKTTVNIEHSSLYQNFAQNNNGGGMYFSSWADTGLPQVLATINNSTISENAASYQGGGIYTVAINNDSVHIQLNNTTVSNNSALSTGGVLVELNALVSAQNSIIYGNAAETNVDCNNNHFDSKGYNLLGSSCPSISTDVTEENNELLQANYSPFLINISQNNGGSTPTLALTANSPARDAGICTSLTDQRYVNRPITEGCDIGAFEYTDQDGDGKEYGKDKNDQDFDNDGYSAISFNGTDCNDNDNTVYENQIYYEDLDSDGLGNAAVSTSLCSSSAPEGYVSNNTDENDVPATPTPTETPAPTTEPTPTEEPTPTPTPTTEPTPGTEPTPTPEPTVEPTPTPTPTTEPTPTEEPKEQQKEEEEEYTTVKVQGATNGNITVTYSDERVVLYPIFTKQTERKTKVKRVNKKLAVVVSANGKAVALVNTLTGEILSSQKLSAKAAYAIHDLKIQKVRKKRMILLTSSNKKKQQGRVAFLTLSIKKQQLKKPRILSFDSALKVKKIKVKKAHLTVRNTAEDTIATYLITKKFQAQMVQ
ncbi:MAG TPA: choice-of-anchor Q domain-containing protein [Patescibacteria group bacterium]|nr:choice-of-anchor Q domain-containing protein [Patescibacteria group bacterium]